MTVSTTQPRVSAWTLHRVTLFLAFAGIFVAGFLTLSSFMKWEIPCGTSHGCDLVEQSADSHVFGIPVALFGLLAYLSLAGLGIWRSFKGENKWALNIKLGLLISGIGTLVSAYLTYDAIENIHATCLWCLGSASLMMLSFFTYGFLYQMEPEARPRTDTPYLVILAALSLLGIGARFVDTVHSEYVTSVNAGALPSKIEGLIPNNAHIMGPADAPVIIIEFGDLLCPHCKESYHEMQKVVQESNGKVEFVFRQFPLMMNPEHKMAASAAVVSELAAEKGKFWNFLDLMYGTIDQEHLDAATLRQAAASVGVTGEEIDKRTSDVNDPAYQAVDRDLQLGIKLNINSTPTLIVGMRGQAPHAGTSLSTDDLLSKPPFSQYVRGLQ